MRPHHDLRDGHGERRPISTRSRVCARSCCRPIAAHRSSPRPERRIAVLKMAFGSKRLPRGPDQTTAETALSAGRPRSWPGGPRGLMGGRLKEPEKERPSIERAAVARAGCPWLRLLSRSSLAACPVCARHPFPRRWPAPLPPGLLGYPVDRATEVLLGVLFLAFRERG